MCGVIACPNFPQRTGSGQTKYVSAAIVLIVPINALTEKANPNNKGIIIDCLFSFICVLYLLCIYIFSIYTKKNPCKGAPVDNFNGLTYLLIPALSVARPTP